MKRGLTLGKFAPFHKGHQLVVETALAEMDEVVVVVYDAPETTLVPLSVRAGWVRALYPSVRVIEAWDGPTAMGDTPEIRRSQEEYIRDCLGLTGITHFYSSEFYGAHMSQALGAIDRRVDPERVRVPISATRIRSNPSAHRAWLDPRVARDLVANIVLLGAPSSGKTTLTERLAQEYGTVWMPEYGREYWERHQVHRRLAPEQLVEIAETHVQREDALLPTADRFLFTDTNALTTWMFAQAYHNSAPDRLTLLADRAASRYDLVFVCDIDIPYHDTWDRSGDVDRRISHRKLLAELAVRRIPYLWLNGDVATRVTQARRVLDRFQKFASVLELFRTPDLAQPDAAGVPESP